VCTGVVRVKGKLRDDANIVGEYLSANWLCLREDLCFDDNVSMVCLPDLITHKSNV